MSNGSRGGIRSLLANPRARNIMRMRNQGMLIPQGSIPNPRGRGRLRVGVSPTAFFPGQRVPTGMNRAQQAFSRLSDTAVREASQLADYLGFRVVDPSTAEYRTVSNPNFVSPTEMEAMMQRGEYGTSDPTPTLPSVERQRRLELDASKLTDMPGGGGITSVMPRADIGDTMQRNRQPAPAPAPITTDPMFGSRLPPAMSSASAIRPVTSATAPEPFSRAEQREGMEGFTSDINQTNEKLFDTLPTRAPDAIGRMPPPLPRPNPRRMEEEQRDPGTDAELDAGIDQAVDTEKDESFKFDPDMDLVRLGLEISAAASKPGATFLGSLAQGGLNHLNRKEKRELIKEDRAYKQSIMKMEQTFKASQNQLDRAQQLGIAQDRIKVLENQNQIRADSLAETIRKNTEMLNIEYKKLPTDKQKDAEGRLLEQKIKVQESTANYYDAKARGEGDALKIQEETTKREYIRAALELIDIDKIDVIGKTEAEKTQIYQAEVKRALSGLQVLSSALDEFLPGVTRGVISSIEGGGGGGSNTRLKFNPETGAIE